jgi:hypothetical protein
VASLRSLFFSSLLVLGPLAPDLVRADAPRWIEPGDLALRDAVERLVDERVIDTPLLAWPIAHAELGRVLAEARARGRVTGEFEPLVARVEAAIGLRRRAWTIAAGNPSDLRIFEDAPRESAELAVSTPWAAGERVGGRARVVLAADPLDGQELRPDGSYAALRAGNWLVSAGWQDRWWGGGLDGSLQLSSNARPVFAASVDRETAAPFESRWLRWIGPWTFGTFVGALEGSRPDVNDALLWGLRIAARPLPGLELSVTRNAQFCGDKPPCGLDAFWDVLVGNDNVGESIAAEDEPGNQLATYEARWGGQVGAVPLSLYVQRTGETIDNRFPRPLRTLNLVSISTWGDWGTASRWRAHLEYSGTICADLDPDSRAPDCGYENNLFTAGYRYRRRVIGHSTDSDTRQWVVGLAVESGVRSWTARLRRAEVNRIGFAPQPNQLLSPFPQLWWVAEGTLRQPLGAGSVDLGFGLEHRRDELRDRSTLHPRGYLRWSRDF